jgi:hypothetical protein
MTDQYSLVEAAVMTKLRTLTDFFPNESQVSYDDSVIQKGANYFAIFMPDAFPMTRADGHDVFVNWVVVFDLSVSYSTRQESLAKFKAVRSSIFNLLYPASLNRTNGVSKIVLSSNGALNQDLAGDNPNFIIQTLSVVVTQRVVFDF